MSKYKTGGVVKYEELPPNWMHPDGGIEFLQKDVEKLFQEQIELLKTVLNGQHIPASVALSVLRGDKDDGD